jgi:peptidoglycan/xylan/chitin deacetylase (PgdA/CDA1 family)
MNEFGRLCHGIGRIAKTRYPRFIFGLSPARGEIPVFTYHDVEAGSFARDLEFLRDNGYRTLGLDEYLGVRQGRFPHAPRSVLLTFDDARKSFHSVALPLLRTFDVRAVLFAPTHWMGRPAGAPDDDLFMSWPQLAQCVASDRVDVESHAHRHALVAVAPRLVDFANPAALRRFDIYDWPMRHTLRGDVLGRPPPGTPIYRSLPLLSATTRYLENEALVTACQAFVQRNGGAAFFAQRDWRAALLSEFRVQARRLPGIQMSAAEIRKLVDSEFELTRAAFREHLGYTPRTLAYPWMLGSSLSQELARRHGFQALFGVALDFGAERRTGSPLPVYGRFKCDWLRFLPGRTRANVFAAIGQKVRGFAGAQHLAH